MPACNMTSQPLVPPCVQPLSCSLLGGQCLASGALLGHRLKEAAAPQLELVAAGSRGCLFLGPFISSYVVRQEMLCGSGQQRLYINARQNHELANRRPRQHLIPLTAAASSSILCSTSSVL